MTLQEFEKAGYRVYRTVKYAELQHLDVTKTDSLDNLDTVNAYETDEFTRSVVDPILYHITGPDGDVVENGTRLSAEDVKKYIENL